MGIEENERLVRRLFDELYNEGRYAIAAELIADGYVSHNKLSLEVLGPEGIAEAARRQRNAFPDQRTEILDLIAQHDRIVVRGVDTGTHTGAPFLGIEPSGRRFEITWIDIFRVAGGKLAEAWLEVDTGELRRQLEG